MTLEEFLADVRHEVDSFEKRWRDGNEKDQKNWPMKLENMAAWYEQFLTHLQTYGRG